jgi:hypothetical protein
LTGKYSKKKFGPPLKVVVAVIALPSFTMMKDGTKLKSPFEIKLHLNSSTNESVLSEIN